MRSLTLSMATCVLACATTAAPPMVSPIPTGARTCRAAWFSAGPSIQYAPGSDLADAPGGAGVEVLGYAAQSILSRGDVCRVRVAGHHSDCPIEHIDPPLSLRRAQAVARWLSSRGVPASRILVEDYAGTQPLGHQNECEPGTLHPSRRVEISVLRCTSQVPDLDELEICSPIPIPSDPEGSNAAHRQADAEPRRKPR